MTKKTCHQGGKGCVGYVEGNFTAKWVSSFLCQEKRSGWLAWCTSAAVTESFLALLTILDDDDTHVLSEMERFIVVMHNRKGVLNKVNEERKLMFAHIPQRRQHYVST